MAQDMAMGWNEWGRHDAVALAGLVRRLAPRFAPAASR